MTGEHEAQAEATDYLRTQLVSAHSFEAAKNVFFAEFHAAAAAERLQPFRAACLQILLDPPNAFAVPYAFAYEARGFLHDHTLWVLPQGDQPCVPRPELLAALEICLARPTSINCRDNYYWPIVAGLTKFVAGDRDGAFRLLALSSMFPDFYRVVSCDLGGGAAFARTYPTPADLLRARQTSRFVRDAEFVTRFSQPPRAVICTAFDRVYGKAFGLAWIRNAETLAPHGVGLHFHAMFRNGIDAAMLADFVREAAALGVPLSISAESGIAYPQAYFASARFLKGASLLRAFDCPALLVDADAFIPDPQRFIDEHLPAILAERRVLGLMSDGPWQGYLPWRRFSAGWIVCPNTQAVQDFLTCVGDAIDYFWDARDHNWWIDQMGLEVGRHLINVDRAAPLGFGQIYLELPQVIDTSEGFKVEKISQLPEMRTRLDAGMSYWQALQAFALE